MKVTKKKSGEDSSGQAKPKTTATSVRVPSSQPVVGAYVPPSVATTAVPPPITNVPPGKLSYTPPVTPSVSASESLVSFPEPPKGVVPTVPPAVQSAPTVVMVEPKCEGILTTRDFEQLWISPSLHVCEETIDMFFELQSKDVEEYMVSADFSIVASGPAAGDTTKMYFQTNASKVPILFEPHNQAAVLVEVLYEQAESQLTITCKSTQKSALSGTLSYAMDLFAG